MQEGIGRSGYRVLALVFFGLAVLGLAIAFVQADPAAGLFDWLGLALAAIACAALLALSLVVLSSRPQAWSSTKDTQPSAALAEELPVTSDPDADLGIEYDDVELLPEDEVSEPTPISTAPPIQPRAPIVVPPRKPQGDTKGWPQRREPTGITRGEMLKQQRAPPQPPAPRTEGRETPLIMARTAASVEATGLPDNMTLGKCGNCNVLLLAPKRRPIRLQCPRCERIHALT